QARAETNEPETLAGADRLAFADETHDAPRHQARDLDHADAPVRRGDYQRIALIVFARLVEFGIDEGARPVGDAIDPASDRRAVDVTIEHAHENGNAQQRPVAKAEFGRRDRIDDHGDTAVGRGDHDALAHRRDADGIAEEQRAPDREHGPDPAQRRPDPEQDQACKRKAADEGIALRVDRGNLRADRIGDGHRYSLGISQL